MRDSLLSTSVRPGDLPDGRRGRHLGKLPLMIAGAIFMALIGTMFYGGYIRSNPNAGTEKTDETPVKSLKGNEFDEFLAQQDNGFIDPEKTQRFETNSGVSGSAHIGGKQVEEKEKELSEIEKLYIDYEKKKIEDYLKAIESKTENSSQALARINQELQGAGGQQEGRSSSASAFAAGGDGGSMDFSKLLTDRMSAFSGLSGGAEDPNLQGSKLAFLNNEGDPTQYLQKTRADQLSPYEVKTGTVIPGVMISGINSDLPGQIIAQVREDVYDTATGEHLLIPQGTRLYGTYDSRVSYGQNRALTVWSRLIYPDGSAQDLGAMGGSDQAGYSGFKDKVNNHYLRTFGSILLLSLFNAIPEVIDDSASQEDPTNGFSNEFEAQLAQTTAQVATEITQKNLEIQPTIIIRPGYKFNIMVNKDIAFLQPYKAYR